MEDTALAQKNVQFTHSTTKVKNKGSSVHFSHFHRDLKRLAQIPKQHLYQIKNETQMSILENCLHSSKNSSFRFCKILVLEKSVDKTDNLLSTP